MAANSISHSSRLHLFDNDAGRDTERLFGRREPDRLTIPFASDRPKVSCRLNTLTPTIHTRRGADKFFAPPVFVDVTDRPYLIEKSSARLRHNPPLDPVLHHSIQGCAKHDREERERYLAGRQAHLLLSGKT